MSYYDDELIDAESARRAFTASRRACERYLAASPDPSTHGPTWSQLDDLLGEIIDRLAVAELAERDRA